MNPTFYPELGGSAAPDADLIVESNLYKRYKVTCNKGIKLKENRSFERKHINVYYVAESALKRLEKAYKVEYKCYLD